MESKFGLFYSILFLYILSCNAYGQTNVLDTIPVKDSLKKNWNGFNIIDNKENSIIQRLSIVGRYHGQYWNVNAKQGKAEGWDNRRIFAGVEAIFFQHFTAHIQIRVSEDFKPIYDGVFQAFLKWTPSQDFSLTLGRIDFQQAGLERTISSNKISTFERSLISNQLWPGEVLGAVIKGKFGDVTYHTGLLAGAKADDIKESDYKRGFGLVVGLGLKANLFYEKGSIHLDYLYNNGKSTINGFEPYNHSFSLWHQGQIGRFSLGTELSAANGINGSKSVMGITLLPSYVLAKDLLCKDDAVEAVLRYQYARSDGNNGLSLQSRYEQEIISNGTGNSYQAQYAGINYLIISNHLKVMTGVEYSAMKDDALAQNSFNGFTYLAGIRIYF